MLQLCALSVEEALAVHPFDHIAPRVSVGVLAHYRICRGGINVSHLLPEIPGSPTNRVDDFVVLDHMTPTTRTAFRAKQLLQPFIAQHQHWLGVDNQFRFFRFHPPLLQLVRLQQM